MSLVLTIMFIAYLPAGTPENNCDERQIGDLTEIETTNKDPVAHVNHCTKVAFCFLVTTRHHYQADRTPSHTV